MLYKTLLYWALQNLSSKILNDSIIFLYLT